jgi:hypothetical protein
MPDQAAASDQVVASGVATYCTIAQFLVRVDWNTVAQLLSDKDANGVITILTLTQVQASDTLLAILKEACGYVEMACIKGERYSVADLVALATGSLADGSYNAGETLAGLVADIALARIYDRRPDRRAEMPERCLEAWAKLDALAEGELIFPFVEAADAGHMDEDEVVDSDLQRRNGLTFQANRYFGNRADRHNMAS